MGADNHPTVVPENHNPSRKDQKAMLKALGSYGVKARAGVAYDHIVIYEFGILSGSGMHKMIQESNWYISGVSHRGTIYLHRD